MKIIVYLRVSTSGQELDNQRLATLDYAYKNIPKASIAKIMDVSRHNLLHFIDSRAL